MTAQRPSGGRGSPFRTPWNPLLRGRRLECESLDQALRDIAAGRSAVRVLRGEAGVGKTALLEYIAAMASECRVARVVGVQSEMELAFAGLHQLCAPLLDGLADLPAPQRTALRVAFGLQEGGAPDHFLVALAVLTLLSETAEAMPLVCVIDDAQWLDRASARALAFVARRLLAEPIAMVFAVREPDRTGDLAGLPDQVVTGLSDDDARLLLAAVVPGRLDGRVRDRILAETRGNPLALLELPRGMTPAELAGGFGIPDAGSLAGHIEQAFLRRLESLPRHSAQLLLLAAAEPLGDVPLLWRAAGNLGIDPAAASASESAGLVELGVRVRFRHPLVRSAAYRAASADERRQVHRALADATDAVDEPDRRAWHRAHAAATLDESVAADLEASAARARRRGGAAAAAAFLRRAAELTPDPSRRGARALAGAQAQLEAAAPDAAADLLATADLCPLDAYQRAQLQRLRAQIAFSLRRGGDALPLLLGAARRLAPFDTALAHETYLEAFAAALFAGRFSNDRDLREVAAAALVARPPAESSSAITALVRGLAAVFIDGYPAAATRLKLALNDFHDASEDDADVNRWLWLACRVASDLFDNTLWDQLAGRGVRVAREAGALGILPMALSYQGGVQLHRGDLAGASMLTEESAAITEATGTALLIYATPMIAAYLGDESRALPQLQAAHEHALARAQGSALSMLDCARAVLSDGPAAEAHYLEAIERLRRAGVALHLARAQLVYGEWLRRENRRMDARARLTDAPCEVRPVRRTRVCGAGSA